MIGINGQTSGNGSIVIYEDRVDTSLRSTSARVARSACLDGTAEIVHQGVSEGDRIFKIYANLSEADCTTLWNIYQLGVNVFFTCSEGFFLGAISSIKLDNGKLYMEFLVKEKKST